MPLLFNHINQLGEFGPSNSASSEVT